MRHLCDCVEIIFPPGLSGLNKATTFCSARKKLFSNCKVSFISARSNKIDSITYSSMIVKFPEPTTLTSAFKITKGSRHVVEVLYFFKDEIINPLIS